MRLVYEETGIEVKVGDIVNLREERAIVKHFAPPHSPTSSGKVTVEICEPGKWTQEFYVSVIGAEWIEREDRE